MPENGSKFQYFPVISRREGILECRFRVQCSPAGAWRQGYTFRDSSISGMIMARMLTFVKPGMGRSVTPRCWGELTAENAEAAENQRGEEAKMMGSQGHVQTAWCGVLGAHKETDGYEDERARLSMNCYKEGSGSRPRGPRHRGGWGEGSGFLSVFHIVRPKLVYCVSRFLLEVGFIFVGAFPDGGIEFVDDSGATV